MERYVWTAHPYVAYTMVDKLFNPFTLLMGPVFVGILVYKSTIPVEQGGYHLPWWNVLASYFVWLVATRSAKLLPHLWHRPQDVIHIPAFILFGYYFSIMKLYALFTLHETGWGTRAGIGDASAATAAMDQAQIGQDEKNMSALSTPYGQSSASPFADGHANYRDSYSERQFQEQVQISPFQDPPGFDEGETYQSTARAKPTHKPHRRSTSKAKDTSLGYAG